MKPLEKIRLLLLRPLIYARAQIVGVEPDGLNLIGNGRLDELDMLDHGHCSLIGILARGITGPQWR
jgi:hypothetical protein